MPEKVSPSVFPAAREQPHQRRGLTFPQLLAAPLASLLPQTAVLPTFPPGPTALVRLRAVPRYTLRGQILPLSQLARATRQHKGDKGLPAQGWPASPRSMFLQRSLPVLPAP